eukprot:UN22494
MFSFKVTHARPQNLVNIPNVMATMKACFTICLISFQLWKLEYKNSWLRFHFFDLILYLKRGYIFMKILVKTCWGGGNHAFFEHVQE